VVVLAIAAAWTTLLALMYWPGLCTEDGATRAIHALALLGDRHIEPRMVSHWFPPGLTLLMSASMRWLGEFGPVPLLQAFWVAASAGWLLVLATGPRVGLVLLAPLLMYPPLFTHAAAHLADAWSVAAMASLSCCALVWHRRSVLGPSARTPAWLRGLLMFLLLVSCVVLLTFRANGVTVMPVLAGLMIWLVRPWPRAVAGLALIGASCLLSPTLVGNIPWARRDTVATSMVWEHVGVLRVANDPKVTREFNLDAACVAPATTEDLIARHTWVSHDSLMWHRPGILHHGVVMQPDRNLIRDRFKALIKSHPAAYLRTKFEVWRTLMGLRGGIPLVYIFRHPPTWIEPFGVSMQPRGPLRAWAAAIDDWNRRNQMRLEYSALPLIWIGAALAALGVALARRASRSHAWPAALLVLLAASYYGAFFLMAPGAQYRYFMPAHVLLYVAIAALMIRAMMPGGGATSRRA
jgi:hypothetical protein